MERGETSLKKGGGFSERRAKNLLKKGAREIAENRGGLCFETKSNKRLDESLEAMGDEWLTDTVKQKHAEDGSAKEVQRASLW